MWNVEGDLPLSTFHLLSWVVVTSNNNSRREVSRTTSPSATPNQRVKNRMSSVAVAAMACGVPSVKASIPAMLTSAAPRPPGREETAPMMVENESTNTAMDAVGMLGGSPRPRRTK